MANLSGQTIQSTYPGLLNLNTATTGITSTAQAITDGLGNDTGARIAQNYFAAPNILNYNSQFVFDYGGTGFGAGSATNPAAIQNRLLYGIFYDTGFNSYSAVSYNLVTATTTSDVVSFSIYTPQYVPGFGIAPKDLIVSGISFTSTGTTGFKTTTLPSTLSFSGTGGGFYIYAFIVNNSGVTPTVRYAVRTQQTGVESLGFTKNASGVSLNPANRISPAALTCINAILSSYTASDITSNFINAAPNIWGFGLDTIR